MSVHLSPEQKRVVETWGQGMAVLAGAGAGKTTTLVIKCIELIKRNPEARFAAVSFTERSAGDLRAKLAQHLTIAPSVVTTIHGLCGMIIREFPREAGYDGEEVMLSEPESQLLWERALDALWLDDLPPDIQAGLEMLLARESRDKLAGLLRRVRDLSGFGVTRFLSTSDDPATVALDRVSAYVMERYTRLKRRRGAMDFNDLEKGADRALEHPRVRASYQKRFDLVLVDEFQDTNPLQASIIWRFVQGDASNLCVVGDPKQSIYRFRDADVSVFDEFCAKLPVRLSLTWNFRSRPGIISYVNTVCEKAFTAASVNTGMKYESLVAKREEAETDPVVRLDVTQPEGLAHWIRGEMKKGIPLHDMALLLRKIRGNEKWLKALTLAGIPIAVGSGGFFWEDPRVRELVAFLKWWDHPGNALSGAVFLRAPWVGISDSQLDQWIKMDPTLREPFFESESVFALALRQYHGKSVAKSVRPGELLMALLVSESVETELGAALLGLWHRVEDLSMRGLDFHSVVKELDLAVQESRRERDVPPPRNLGQLVVLTLHGSKGLEFPHVILIDLGKKPRAPESPLLYWDRTRGVYLGKRDEEGQRLSKDPVESEWKEQERNKNLAESMRIFYVALTRAKERLVLVCPNLSERSVDELDPETVFKTDYWRGWIECSGAPIPKAEVPKGDISMTKIVATESGWPSMAEMSVQAFGRFNSIRVVRPRHSVTEWNLLARCPRAYEWTYIRPVGVDKSDTGLGGEAGRRENKFSSTQVSQREIGTRVHACLEESDWEGLRAIEAEVGSDRFNAEKVIEWANSYHLMKKDGHDVFTELDFEVPIGGEILVGSIDRLVVEPGDANPKYTLMDFKVTAGRKDRATLLDAYRTQLVLYAEALRKLEPTARHENIAGLLVSISASSIETFAVDLCIDTQGERLTPAVRSIALAHRAAEIVAGRIGEPRLGKLCEVCQFKRQCKG